MQKIRFGLSLLLIIVLLSSCFGKKTPQAGPVTLNVYGLDNSDVFAPMISAYKQKKPLVTIKYKKFNDPAEFEQLVINEIAEGEGPDVFYMHNTWLPRHNKKVVPLTSETLTPKNFAETFVNVAKDDFVQPDPTDGAEKIFGLPLYVDTLALYYNKRDFEQKIPERGKPGTLWSDVEKDAPLLREEDAGLLTKGAYALGRADNIQNGVDILYNLFLQGGVSLYDQSYKLLQFSGSGQKWFDYLLGFAQATKKNYSWSETLADPQSDLKDVEAFLAGKVSAIFGYSDLYSRFETDIKNVKAKNGSAIDMKDIAVAPLPQLSADAASAKVLASYYGLGVSRNSKNAAAAWDFVQFVTTKENAAAFHTKTKRPTARRDLIADQKKEPITEVFVGQLGYASSYRIYSVEKFKEVFTKAITSSLASGSARSALGEAQTELNDMIKIEAPEGLYPKVVAKPKK